MYGRVPCISRQLVLVQGEFSFPPHFHLRDRVFSYITYLSDKQTTTTTTTIIIFLFEHPHLHEFMCINRTTVNRMLNHEYGNEPLPIFVNVADHFAILHTNCTPLFGATAWQFSLLKDDNI